MNEIEKDAARYRWLRATQNANFRDEFSTIGAIGSIMVCEEPGDSGDASAPHSWELDALIDAAMQRWDYVAEAHS